MFSSHQESLFEVQKQPVLLIVSDYHYLWLQNYTLQLNKQLVQQYQSFIILSSLTVIKPYWQFTFSKRRINVQKTFVNAKPFKKVFSLWCYNFFIKFTDESIDIIVGRLNYYYNIREMTHNMIFLYYYKRWKPTRFHLFRNYLIKLQNFHQKTGVNVASITHISKYFICVKIWVHSR